LAQNSDSFGVLAENIPLSKWQTVVHFRLATTSEIKIPKDEIEVHCAFT